MNSLFLIAILFVFAFLIVSGGIAAIIVTTVVRKRRNDRAPQITVDASVLEKHTSTQRHPIAGDASGGHGYMDFTVCHVTFRTADGEQKTFEVDKTVYEQLKEGDRGQLSCQGTQFLGFVRSV